ncbi:hypothetical protein GCM10010145_16830 [Streptomyces ruber]|uniref:Uncharacterized protein n=2 Tax=Streptomyces TaxID=1883 RepID=A0A918BA05_9ACTN|nr:hypothetical protein [Streptomyces ruber]GGQ48706.1 hypothetical protein GCM10010145_16830 [Streptomyces ruber]
MRQSRTYVYKVLQSSWGIRIAITATAELQAGREEERLASDLPVWLAFAGSAAELSPLDKERLAEGLSSVAFEVSRRVDGRPVTVTVGEVSYVESDFQIEGLSVAMCRWAEAEFNLPQRQIIESFDRVANRYLFDWQ